MASAKMIVHHGPLVEISTYGDIANVPAGVYAWYDRLTVEFHNIHGEVISSSGFGCICCPGEVTLDITDHTTGYLVIREGWGQTTIYLPRCSHHYKLLFHQHSAMIFLSGHDPRTKLLQEYSAVRCRAPERSCIIE